MPIADVRGTSINYEVLGNHGPWVALSPGGRRALDNVKPLARHMAAAGYRVLVHDRRNCGMSDIVIGGDQSEYEMWADDLHELLSQLEALPAVVGGGSSGCRLSVLFALKYPNAARALLLWRVTGGAFAAQRLTENYYDKYIRAAQEGGMAAVCGLDHFNERIEARPSNRQTLMAMDPRNSSPQWSGGATSSARAPNCRSSARASATSTRSGSRPASSQATTRPTAMPPPRPPIA